MRSRAIHVVVVVLAVAGLMTVGVGSAAASHGGSVDDDEIIEIQRVSDDPERGLAHVELRYHIGSDVTGLKTRIRTEDHEVVGVDGFSPTSTATEYEWDGQTTEPTISVRVAIDEPVGDEYNYVDAGDWLITNRPLLVENGLRGYDVNNIEIDRRTTAGDEGVAADGMIYLGEYESYEFSSADEQFELVISEAADPDWTVAEIRERLIASSDRFDVGGKSDRVTVFAVTDPLREGGLATSTNAAVWMHEAGLTESQTTLFHEYVHSRQEYDRSDVSDDAEWIIEGSADYYGALLALKGGSIEYHRFHHLLEQGNGYNDVVLADKDTWRGTLNQYEVGALVLATMDERLRDDGATYADLFRAKNAADNQITDSNFESLAVERDGDMADFFDQHIRSTPRELSVPDPTVYDGPNTGATLDLSVPELDLATGETERVTATLANTGTESSLAPQLSADASDDVSVSLVDSDGSAVTQTEEGWVFDHLPAGDRYELTLTVEAEATDGEQIQFSVGDLSTQRDSVSVTLDSSEPLTAALDAKAAGTVGETINATAATTPDDLDIDEYSFTITGPDGERRIDGSVPTVMFSPEESGEYTVSVTATAADGRTATANRFVDVAPAETDDGSTGEETPDDDSTADEADATNDGSDETADDGLTETVDNESDASSDGFGDGFGPAVVVVGILGLTLLARRRPH